MSTSLKAGQAAITTPHPLATDAGLAVLRRGGTAAEAVIAAGAVLAVVCPHFCGIGGDAVWILAGGNAAKSDGPSALLAIGQGIESDLPQAPIPLRGPRSIMTTAALVDGWEQALSYSQQHWGGASRLGDLLAPAIGFARDGFASSASQQFWAEFRKHEAQDWSGFAELYLPQGRVPAAGSLLIQKNLARTLEAIAQDGAAAMRQGPLAQAIIAGLRAAGAQISLTDLAATRARMVPALTTQVAGYHLLAPPPPTQGVTTLMIMAILDRLAVGQTRPASADHFHLCVEAVKQAFMTRGQIADPAMNAQPIAAWLSPEAIGAKAAAISSDRALDWPHRWQHGDTVFLAAMDEAGNGASCLQSTYFDWGSGVVAGDTGILWQNRGAAFAVEPSHPNCFAPGKLPFYTLNPGMALKDGVPAILYGTQGADGQPQTLAMMLSHLLWHGAEAEAALAAPRFLLGRTFSDSRDSLKIEGHADAECHARLAAMGHELSPIPPFSPLAGQAGLIVKTATGLTAAHDPRGEGIGAVL